MPREIQTKNLNIFQSNPSTTIPVLRVRHAARHYISPDPSHIGPRFGGSWSGWSSTSINFHRCVHIILFLDVLFPPKNNTKLYNPIYSCAHVVVPRGFQLMQQCFFRQLVQLCILGNESSWFICTVRSVEWTNFFIIVHPVVRQTVQTSSAWKCQARPACLLPTATIPCMFASPFVPAGSCAPLRPGCTCACLCVRACLCVGCV